MKTLSRYIFLFFFSCIIFFINADDIERTARKGVVIKLLREMVNQTKADTLNLPANASSIRENITDTFSCENRTYGYYADVDNECQIFHVCLTSQATSSRSVTYRWSFICPNETLFNQEVLTCTRPRDSIPCEESPMFYHLNDEIGKVPNDTDTQMASNENMNNNYNMTNDNSQNINSNNNMRKRKPVKKQNLIVENLMKEVVKRKLAVESFDEDMVPVIEETADFSKETSQVETEFDDVMMVPDAVEVIGKPNRNKTPKKPTNREVVKKPNKKNKVAIKPLATMIRPRIEPYQKEKPQNLHFQQEDTMNTPQREIIMSPLMMKPDIMDQIGNKESIDNTKPAMDKKISKPNEDTLKVIPQRGNNKNAEPSKDNKVMNMNGSMDGNNVKPIKAQSNSSEFSNLGYEVSKEVSYAGSHKLNEERPVTRNIPEIHEVNGEYKMKGKRMENSRLASERSMRRKGKKINRGFIRFSSDKL